MGSEMCIRDSIEAESTASASIKKMEGNYFNSDLTYGLTLDKRNQAFQPTEGYATSFYQTLPLIMDSSSLKNTFHFAKYNGFSEDVIGSFNFQAKTIHGIDDDVRLSQRLYVPRRKLRGFANGKVGPKDGKDWIGGNYVTAFSAEAELPNYYLNLIKRILVCFSIQPTFGE